MSISGFFVWITFLAGLCHATIGAVDQDYVKVRLIKAGMSEGTVEKLLGSPVGEFSPSILSPFHRFQPGDTKPKTVTWATKAEIVEIEFDRSGQALRIYLLPRK